MSNDENQIEEWVTNELVEMGVPRDSASQLVEKHKTLIHGMDDHWESAARIAATIYNTESGPAPQDEDEDEDENEDDEEDDD